MGNWFEEQAKKIKKEVDRAVENTQAYIKNPGEALQQDINRQIGDIKRPFQQQDAGEINIPVPGRQVEQPVPEQDILTEQQKGYQDYMKRLPSFQKQMAEGLAKQSMQTMTGQQRQAEQRNVSRGLGYGALNEANKEQIRAQNQQQLVSAIQQGNLGLLGLGEQMQSGIVSTGKGMQADAQNRMNIIYNQQMAELQRQASQTSGLFGLIGTGVGLYLSGGNPAGGMVGGQIGSNVGSQFK